MNEKELSLSILDFLAEGAKSWQEICTNFKQLPNCVVTTQIKRMLDESLINYQITSDLYYFLDGFHE